MVKLLLENLIFFRTNNSLSSIGLADNLREIGFEIGRFKTGTPPRVFGKFY
ncbi:FAD-dependent oxidoreductase [Lactococcus lactis]|uniref:FAD-dependent oxidoreductase n=1 Tax=Lactococcus lactis TaxID=1358 RepID=UPI003C6FB504